MESQKALIARSFLFMLGMTAMATQVIMIRETLAIFSGNELIIGLFLGIWMALTATGSFLSVQRFSLTPLSPRPPVPPLHLERGPGGVVKLFHALLLLLLALLPLATLFFLVILRFAIVPAGIMPGLGQTALVITLALLPFCIVSGMLFPILVKELSGIKSRNLLHEGYALDSAGSILGGLLFSLLFIFTLPPYESLLLLSLLCMAVIMIQAVLARRIFSLIIIFLFGTTLIIADLIVKPARILDNRQFSNQLVKEIKSSPYGMLAVTKMGEQIIIYENGIQVISSDDPVYREESVHYTMLLHPNPKNVLVISGGYSGIIEEILKYQVDMVNYVESDRWLLDLMKKYRKLPDDERINYFMEDPKIFLSKNSDHYDIILLNTPEPNSAALNRFYTVDFYRLLKENLNPGGIVSMSIPAAGNYLSETSRQVHSVNYNSLRAVFSQVRIIPGGKDYFLASDSILDSSFFTGYEGRGFSNLYVNPHYINENLLKMRTDLIIKDLIPGAGLNSDLKPYIFSLYLKQWQERYKINNWAIPLILLLILILSLIFLGPLNLGLFAGGFTASGLEFILLIWFQVIYGNVYQMTGLIFALFMAGLAIGSGFRVPGSGFLSHGDKKPTYRRFLKIQGAFAIFSLIIALLIPLFSSSPLPLFSSSPLPGLHAPMPPSLHAYMPPGLFITLIFTLVFITGLLMGLQFFISAQLRKEDIRTASGEAFSADLLGSAVGIILVSVYLLPLLGLPMTSLILAGLNLLVVGVGYIRR